MLILSSNNKVVLFIYKLNKDVYISHKTKLTVRKALAYSNSLLTCEGVFRLAVITHYTLY